MGYSRCLLVILALGIIPVKAGISDKLIIQNSDNSSLYRLPKNVVPEFYDVLLITNVTRGNFDYHGEVTIDLHVTNSTKQVIVHADKLQIRHERTKFQKVLSTNNFEDIEIKSQYNNSDTQFHVINFFDDLKIGRYLLKLFFRGEVLDDVFGFYRTSYKVQNLTRWMGITQFSPTFARRAFPCMDEPGFKAAFQLRIGHYENETVTSNTFPESRIATDQANYYITTFKKTPRMSTYLFGWAVHDLKKLNVPGASIPLWTRFNASELPKSLSLFIEGPKIFAVLEGWTNLSNPLGKIEQFAVPDFNFNGMENWGLITFRESVPLVSEEQTPERAIHDSLVTIAHEYAHSWFGNLVTPVFWDVAWLKEGFATYFAYLSMDLLHENWRAMNLFSLECLQASLLADSEDHNRTMNGHNVGSPKSAKAALDFVTYKKGASIIRMIADILGNNTFKNAMRSYLKENRYNAVTPSDLYKYLEEANNLSAKAINFPTTIGNVIESWASQPNYPLVNVSRVGPRHLSLCQGVFRINHGVSLENEERSWWIPLKILFQLNTNESRLREMFSWLEPTNKCKTLELPNDVSQANSWFLLNSRQVGYYRVNYDVDNWQSLKDFLNSDDYQILPSIDRAALIDDVFNLAKAGYQKYKLAFELAGYLHKEVEYEPWVTGCRAIRLIDDKLKVKQDAQKKFRRYAVSLINEIYKKFDFKTSPNNSLIEKLHQNLILSTACSLNVIDCVSTAQTLFRNWIDDAHKTVPANFKDFVYRTSILYGTNEDWIALWERFLHTELDSEKEVMLRALSGTRNVSSINKYLEFAIQPDSPIKKQYRSTIIQSIITENDININHVINFVDSNLEKIIDLHGSSFLEEILTSIGKQIISIEQETKLTVFLNSNVQKLGNAFATGKSALATAKKNIAWINSLTTQIIDDLP